ncbi:MAG: RluA family pseudouridine synthase [Planctomycetes bacterium]|nr:RluA family pseudouridine synthase [Planctomycetota bacterium]
MSGPQLQVLYEDNHLLAVLKPAMVPTMGAPEGGPSLLAMAQSYIRHKYQKTGAVYLGIVSRLDAPVTGVVLIARTSKAAARLTAAYASREVEKQYWAVVEGDVDPPADTCEDWLRKDERHRCVHITNRDAKGAQLARLSYRRVRPLAGATLLEVELETGRKHQIRVQLSSRGFPILGDQKYGARRSFAAGIALHSRRLAIVHPVRGTRLEIIAPLPPAWRALGIVDQQAQAEAATQSQAARQRQPNSKGNSGD